MLFIKSDNLIHSYGGPLGYPGYLLHIKKIYIDYLIHNVKGTSSLRSPVLSCRGNHHVLLEIVDGE
jgi:hypothetical protein